jgi:hypothetical protein
MYGGPERHAFLRSHPISYRYPLYFVINRLLIVKRTLVDLQLWLIVGVSCLQFGHM